MSNSKRKCTACEESFPQSDKWIQTPAGWFHNYDCAISHGMGTSKKAKRKKKEQDKKIRKQKLEYRKNDKPYRAKQAQSAFNKFIRERDKNDPCISCGRYHAGQYHAGHYRSVGAAPELRFEELNCHKQCMPCNAHLSGNIAEYRINLIKKIGLDKVEWLEGKHEPKRYTAQDYLEIEKKYKEKVKELLYK